LRWYQWIVLLLRWRARIAERCAPFAAADPMWAAEKVATVVTAGMAGRLIRLYPTELRLLFSPNSRLR
jgi:hypothetical protein